MSRFETDSDPRSIVAVHGLNPFSSGTNAYTTWTADESGVERNWLIDDTIEGFLPKTLPKARVMVFGYNSNAVFGGSTATVNEHAENLLKFLRTKRLKVSHGREEPKLDSQLVFTFSTNAFVVEAPRKTDIVHLS